MRSRPTCGELIWSWILGLGGLTLIGVFGHVGFLFAFAPLAIAQRIRQPHDKNALERYKQSTACKAFAFVYYAALLDITAVAGFRGTQQVIDLPLGLSLGVFFLPFIIGMFAADHAVCSACRQYRSDYGIVSARHAFKSSEGSRFSIVLKAFP
jgi:hypothetical protein